MTGQLIHVLRAAKLQDGANAAAAPTMTMARPGPADRRGSAGPRHYTSHDCAMKEETKRRVMEYGSLILYSEQLYETLWGDIALCEAMLQGEDIQPIRRQLVRAAFALTEASTFYLKQLALSASEDAPAELHRAVRALLADESYELQPDGRVRVRNARIPTLANIRLSLKAVAVYVAPGFEPQWGDGGWEALQKSLKVRDRLMHPKSVADLAVSDEELAKTRQALSWYRTSVANVFKTAADNHLAEFNRLTSQAGRPENLSVSDTGVATEDDETD
jgi:hypothetical protein